METSTKTSITSSPTFLSPQCRPSRAPTRRRWRVAGVAGVAIVALLALSGCGRDAASRGDAGADGPGAPSGPPLTVSGGGTSTAIDAPYRPLPLAASIPQGSVELPWTLASVRGRRVFMVIRQAADCAWPPTLVSPERRGDATVLHVVAGANNGACSGVGVAMFAYVDLPATVTTAHLRGST